MLARCPGHHGIWRVGSNLKGLNPPQGRPRDIPMMHDEPGKVPFDTVDGAEEAVTEPQGALDDRLEHWLSSRRGARDPSQDLRGARLLLEGLRQLAVSRLEFREQAHVLDGDHRLISERLD